MGDILNNKAIGARLKKTRLAAQLSQEQFASALTTALRAYQNYERGEREIPSPLILLLHREFHIDPVWLLAGTSGSGQKKKRRQRAYSNWGLQLFGNANEH